MSTSTRTRTESGRFWDWLAANTPRIQAGLRRSSRQIATELSDRFERAYPGLTWEVTPADKGPWVFCISANGDRKLFPRVTKAAAEAPKLDGWTIQPFRPRGPADAEISMDGHTLDAGDIWCEVERAKGGGVSLVLHIRGVTVETEQPLSNAALVLLDNAVGEYDSVMKIADIDLALLEGKPKASDRFFPLRDLPAFLDGIKDA